MGRRIVAVKTRRDRALGLGWEIDVVGLVALVEDHNDVGNVANQVGTLAFDQNVGDIAPDCQSSHHIEPGAGTAQVGLVVGRMGPEHQ